MGQEIKRINSYDDKRFPKDILKQHGAFIVDGKYKCSFKIINENSCIVDYDKEVKLDEIINEFRFYTEHITKFYNINNELIKEFPSVNFFEVDIEMIQPSQFYVDLDKVNAVSAFINNEKDIIIPLMKKDKKYISLDGHTRLYYGVKQGYKKVMGFITEAGDYINDFVVEAQNRGVYTPKDLVSVTHEEYEVKWNKFCDDFFKDKE